MRHVLLALGLFVFTATAAWASPEVICLQKALAGIGFDPGPADGDFGGRTKRAGDEVVARFFGGVAEPPFEEPDAATWCKKIGEQFPNVSKFYKELMGEELPAFDPNFRVEGARYEFLIDPDFYLAQLPNPKVAEADPRAHYLYYGWKDAYWPSPWFDPEAYLAANPDVAAMKINPLAHYVEKGMEEYRGFGAQPDESGFIFDVGPGVTAKQEAVVKQGVAIAQDYFAEHFGLAFPPELAAKITIKLEATGRGSREPGNNGGNATGLSSINDMLPRPYFDMAHPDTNQDTSGRGWSRETEQLSMVVHEMTHGWQTWLGAMSIYEQPLGNWMNEGIASYTGWHAVAELGRLDIADVYRFQAKAARSSGELDVSLREFGSSQTSVWAGHIGFLAVDWLVDECPNGETALVLVAEALKAGRATGGTVRQAFKAAFGMELDDFYEQFEPWRVALRANPAKAVKNRPDLVCGEAG